MSYRRLGDGKKVSLFLPEYLLRKADAEVARKGLSRNAVLIEAIDKGLAKVEVPEPPESPEWASGWPKLVPCNRCDKRHDPMEHQLNQITGALAEAKLLGGQRG